ncbi:RNA polymerase sigma factor [Roseimaritima sediminicola]|uniref:RNA polymerase sigma factor n=1 Tax=Roseimaritima sediminicola TaxID=2662066 RepID=UPI001298368D|nr:sigma-70 family RNA polymerase sigma factor [Roseimaritima sediminicola]
MSVSNNSPSDPSPAGSADARAPGGEPRARAGGLGGAAEASQDQAVIDRTLRGEAEAFDELVRSYAPRLVRMAYALVGNREDAEDLAQEAFSKAYFKLDSFAGRSSFFTWLYRITVNLSISKRRKRRLETTHQAVALDDAPPPATDSTADGAVDTQEQIAQLRQAIDQLEGDRRAVLVLRDLEGLDYDQIAKVLEIPKGTVRSRLHRARSDLKQLMQRDAMTTVTKAASSPSSQEPKDV